MCSLSSLLRRQQALLVICLATAGWSFAFRVGAPLSSLWLAHHNCADSITGDNTGVCYLGMALASAAVPWLMRRWGKGCPALGMVGFGLTTAAFPYAASLSGWFLLRLVGGAG